MSKANADVLWPELASVASFSLLVLDDGTAETVTLGEERCLCVFTDADRIGAYIRGRYGDNFETQDVKTLEFDSQAKLVGFLKANEAGLASQGVTHLALNPVADKSILRIPVRALLDTSKS